MARYKNKDVRTLEKGRGEIFHVDDLYQLTNMDNDLMVNYPNDMSDDMKAKKGFKITVTIEYN